MKSEFNNWTPQVKLVDQVANTKNYGSDYTRSKQSLEVEEDCTLYGVSIINLPSAETHGSVPCWKNVTCQEKV